MEFIGNLISSIFKAPFICISWIVVGAIAGDLARRFMGAKDRNLFSDILLGILGALIGGFLAGILGLYKPDGGLTLVLVNLIIATAGAMVLIGIRRALTGSKR